MLDTTASARTILLSRKEFLRWDETASLFCPLSPFRSTRVQRCFHIFSLLCLVIYLTFFKINQASEEGTRKADGRIFFFHNLDKKAAVAESQADSLKKMKSLISRSVKHIWLHPFSASNNTTEFSGRQVISMYSHSESTPPTGKGFNRAT